MGTVMEKAERMQDRQVGLILVGAVSASLFVAMTAAFVVLSAGGDSAWTLPDKHLQLALLWLGVVVLGIGSFMLHTAEKCLRLRDQIGFRATMLNGAAKATAWLLITGLMWFMLQRKGFIPTSGSFPALFYLMSGYVAVHVLGTLVLLVPAAVRSALPEAPWLAALRAVYWYTTGIAALAALLFS